MIKHIVFFKLKDRSEEAIQRTAEILRSMDGKMEFVRSLEIGVDVLKTERSFDISLTAVVDSLEDLEAYQVHPVHQEIIKHMSEVKDSAVAVDYEV